MHTLLLERTFFENYFGEILMRNKKGFQLSVNMLVVIILGIVILGMGLSIFFTIFNKGVDFREDMDEQTRMRLENLMDDGDPIVVGFTDKDGKRGSFVDFDIGINNELGLRKNFCVQIFYAGTTASEDLYSPSETRSSSCLISDSESTVDDCGDLWPLYIDYIVDIENNEKGYVPVRIQLPKKLKKGQYIFNVDVFVPEVQNIDEDYCITHDFSTDERYFSRKKLTVTV